MIMSKWKYLFGAASLVAAMTVPSKLMADPNVTLSLVPVSASAGDTINGQNVTVGSVGDQVVMDIYETIAQANGTWTDDAPYLYKAAFYSTSSGSGLEQGNFDNGTGTPLISFSGVFQTSGTSSKGAEVNGYDPGYGPAANYPSTSTPDPLTNTAEQSTGNSSGTPLQFSTGATPAYGSGSSTPTSTSPYTVLLGTITWTDTSTAGGTATVNAVYQSGMTSPPAANKQIVEYYSDGTLYKESTTNANGNLLSGSPVVITTPSAIPEPASLGLIGLGITSLGVRARRRSVKA
jgi:hypothetical protein